MTEPDAAVLLDVVVLGAGISGLCAARHLLRESPGLRIGLVDPGRLPADKARSKVGESATEASSWYLVERLGLGEVLEGTQIKKLGLRFFLPGVPGTDFSARAEYGLMAAGPGSFSVPFAGLNPITWQLHRGRLEAGLFDELVQRGVTVRSETRSTVQIGAPHVVALDGPMGAERWTTRWLIDASGGAWAVPTARTDDAPLDHRAQAAWFWVPGRIDPDLFSAQPEFGSRIPPDMRWRSTNHLIGSGYWIWLIALADGSTSVGVVSDPAVHPAEQFETPVACRDWITRHEPELSTMLARQEWRGYARRGWESHARRTLVSPERWAVTGDTAAFLDPLFSSGLDLMAIGNELLVPLILADLAGRDVGREARRASSLFARIVEQYLHLYQGSYRVMAHPRAMMAKIVWDISVYLGFLAPVVRSGRLADEAFMTRVGFVGQGIATLQHRVSRMLVAWAGHLPSEPAHGWVDQGACAPLLTVVHRLRTVHGDDIVGSLATNLALLEQLAVALFRQAGSDIGLVVPAGPVNPYAIGLDPTSWAADGLVGGAHPVTVDPTLAAGLEQAWLRP